VDGDLLGFGCVGLLVMKLAQDGAFGLVGWFEAIGRGTLLLACLRKLLLLA